ncbi:MAG TPA: PadR family transcriptional regulator [Longimicrobium sp.]|nr:PadR family transcriptional regulator [Longimicrobium sp.]
MEIPSLSKKEAEILRLLIANDEMYGLQMVNESDQLKRGTIYVTLARMAEKGYVESRDEEHPASDRPTRKLYKASGYGVRAYRSLEAARRSFIGGTAWAT